MNSDHAAAARPLERTRRQRLAPALTLVLLSPFIAEVLSGATRLSFIFAFVPEILVWGVGTLIIRELALRWRTGWTGILLMGLGLSIAEEFVIQQTSIAPLPWLGSAVAYGRVFGVNWVYFLYMLGYESVWVVLVPILLTLLLFPERCEEPWLRPRGFFLLGALFLMGSFMAWFAWTQRARPLVFHVAKYQPPLITILSGIIAIALLFAVAGRLRQDGERGGSSPPAPQPWVVLLSVLVLGLPWNLLLVLVFVPSYSLPLWIPMLAGCIWAFLAYLLIRYWGSLPGWKEMHRWAVVFAATLECMAGGFLGSSAWPRMDIVAKLVLNAAMLVWLLWLAQKVRHRMA